MKTLAIVLSLGVLVASGAAAQDRPDFSGEWTLQADNARGAGEFGSGWGRTIEIEQSANTLTLLWPFYTPGDLQPPLRFRYALDGSAVTNTIMMGRGMQDQVSRATWEGNKLVITTDHAGGRAGTTTVTRVLSLESPTSLLVETKLSGDAAVSRSVYARS